jgi:hypothetical protein
MSIRWLAIGVLAVTVVYGQTVLTDPKKIADAQKLVVRSAVTSCAERCCQSSRTSSSASDCRRDM